MKDTLFLSLKKLPFELMVAGLKPDEFRKPSAWIIARLVGKKYKYIKFTNGYGPDKPWFKVEYNGYSIASIAYVYHYSNGLVVFVLPGDYVISLGKIIDSGNLKRHEHATQG